MRFNSGREWSLGEQIGGGGFGQVYAATSNGDEAVVKLVPKAPGAQREMLFENLAGARNVVPIIDRGETETHWALVLPRADKSLRQHLASIFHVDSDEALKSHPGPHLSCEDATVL